MISNNKTLLIFDRFQIDNSLPKYVKSTSIDLLSSINVPPSIGSFSFIPDDSSTWGNTNIPFITMNEHGVLSYGDKKKSLVTRIIDLFKAKNEIKVLEKKRALTIIQFFSSLATNLNELNVLTDIGIYYETAITNADKAGQIALVEQLKKRLNSAKSEAQLVAYGLNLYLTEEQIVQFYHNTKEDKNLKLTWIQNFIKPIPTKILDVKEKLDKTFVFDNYVILHYDPNNTATNLTKAEQERRDKDPIIFGLIEGSRRLYYVGDWIDDYCNLTLDVVIETLNEKAHEINNENVKTFIDRGREKEITSKINKESVDPKKVIIKEPIMIKENRSKEKTKKKKK